MDETRSEPRGDEERVDALLFRVLEQPGDRDAALEEACAANPVLAATLRERFDALCQAGLVPGAATDEQRFPERLGDFRLLRRLGGGGMGVVYRAEQLSLGREVALKLIRPEHLFFPRARERFRREVHAIATLQHPNIVPVYAGGEEEGIPFFAMELLQGCTLAEVLGALSGRAPESLDGGDLARVVAERAARPAAFRLQGTWIECAVRIAQQVAEALQHAHDRGIVHRDVKPSNIALTPDGRALLLDFGLTTSSEQARVTRTGMPVGTLLYMSPEQLAGATDLDARTDVYSLGATLYELLTLQPAYGSEQSDPTVDRIREGRLDPMRVRNRRVPADLETVCRKAMDPDRGRRYATARAFAGDLQNVLERRPILARPPGVLLRARRWTQRRPALAYSLALGLLVLVGVPTALWIQQRAYARDLEAAVEQHRTVAGFLVGLFQDADPGRRGRELGTEELLRRGRERLETELAALPHTRASLQVILGEVHYSLGLYDEARAMLESAVSTLEALEPAKPETEARAALALAQVEQALGQRDAAAARLEQALRAREGVDGDRPWQTGQLRAALARMRGGLGRLDEAEALSRRALQELREHGAPQEVLARARVTLGNTLLRRGRDRAAAGEGGEDDLAAAIEELQAGAASIAAGGHTLEAAGIENSLGLACKELGRLEEAEEHYGRALTAFREVLGPRNDRVAVCSLNLAGLARARGDLDRALALMDEAVAGFRASLPAGHPYLSFALERRAGDLFESGDLPAAREAYRELLALQREAEPDAVATTLVRLSACARAAGDWDAAESRLVEAARLCERQYGLDDPRTRRARERVAELHEARGRPDLAAEWR